MKTPSRNMPPYEPPNTPIGIVGWIFVIFLLSVFTFLIWQEPWLLLTIPLIYLVSHFDNKRRKRKFISLSDERDEQSICEFARAFERHKVDTWVIRAVYEQTQEYVSMSGVKLPLKATDDIFEFLEIDYEDLDLDIVEEVAQRARRSMKDTQRNPYYGKVQTLGDLVHFINEQPLT